MVKEYSEKELKLIKKIDFKKIENDNRLSICEGSTTISAYRSQVIFAIQDAFVQGYNLGREVRFNRI